MEEALRSLLIGDATIAAMVPAAKIVWNHLPQATQRPAIVLYRVSGAQGVSMQGSDGLLDAIVQIDIQALSVTSMWAIRNAVVACLHGHRDETFRGIMNTSERQSSELLAGVAIHRASLDFDVWARA